MIFEKVVLAVVSRLMAPKLITTGFFLQFFTTGGGLHQCAAEDLKVLVNDIKFLEQRIYLFAGKTDPFIHPPRSDKVQVDLFS